MYMYVQCSCYLLLCVVLQEFMLHRRHTFMRLDGSSKISDRRDMVSDFQNRSDIFAFLLSTRAGGLGINLTAADTVRTVLACTAPTACCLVNEDSCCTCR